MDKINEKSVSKSQQRLMGQAYAYKKGDLKNKDLNPKYSEQIKKLADSMTLKQLKDFASTKHKGLKESNILSFEMFLEKLNSNKLYDFYYKKFKNSEKEEELDYKIYTSIRNDFMIYIEDEINNLIQKEGIARSYSDLCKTNRNPKEDFKMILDSLSDDFKLDELKKIFNPEIDAICNSTIEDLYLKNLNQVNGLVDLFFYFLLLELGYSNEKIELGGDGWPLCILETHFGKEDAEQELMIRYKYGYHRTDYGKLAILQAGLTPEEFKKKGVKHLVEIIDEEFNNILYKSILFKNDFVNMSNELGKLQIGWTKAQISSHIFNLLNLNFDNYHVIEEDRILIMTDDIKYDLNEVINKLKFSKYFKLNELETSDINKVFKRELDIYELDITEGDLNLMIWDEFE